MLNFRLKTLRLDRNRLSNYNGEFFVNMGNDTDLHTLDLSYNELNYLYDGAFDYLPNLKNLDFSHNKFTFFPTDSVRSLGQLEGLDLGHNMIKVVSEAQFANFPLLRSLDLSHNDIDMVSEDAFQSQAFVGDMVAREGVTLLEAIQRYEQQYTEVMKHIHVEIHTDQGTLRNKPRFVK